MANTGLDLDEVEAKARSEGAPGLAVFVPMLGRDLLALVQRLRATEALVRTAFDEGRRDGAQVGYAQEPLAAYPDHWESSVAKASLHALREGRW